MAILLYSRPIFPKEWASESVTKVSLSSSGICDAISVSELKPSSTAASRFTSRMSDIRSAQLP
ncbi:hypothetical protein D3C73_1619600 [compost metagenome]